MTKLNDDKGRGIADGSAALTAKLQASLDAHLDQKPVAPIDTNAPNPRAQGR